MRKKWIESLYAAVDRFSNVIVAKRDSCQLISTFNMDDARELVSGGSVRDPFFQRHQGIDLPMAAEMQILVNLCSMVYTAMDCLENGVAFAPNLSAQETLDAMWQLVCGEQTCPIEAAQSELVIIGPKTGASFRLMLAEHRLGIVPQIDETTRLELLRRYSIRDSFEAWESSSGARVMDLSTVPGLGLDGDGEAADEIHGRLRQAFEAGAKGSLDSLTPEQRLEIMADYCTGCGVKDSRCPCRNDE